MVIRSFKKYEFITAPDGSKDDQVNSERIEGYVIPEAGEEFHLEFSTDDDYEDDNISVR